MDQITGKGQTKVFGVAPIAAIASCVISIAAFYVSFLTYKHIRHLDEENIVVSVEPMSWSDDYNTRISRHHGGTVSVQIQWRLRVSNLGRNPVVISRINARSINKVDSINTSVYSRLISQNNAEILMSIPARESKTETLSIQQTIEPEHVSIIAGRLPFEKTVKAKDLHSVLFEAGTDLLFNEVSYMEPISQINLKAWYSNAKAEPFRITSVTTTARTRVLEVTVVTSQGKTATCLTSPPFESAGPVARFMANKEMTITSVSPAAHRKGAIEFRQESSSKPSP